MTLLEDVISEIDLVCLMSVNPGYGGQKFIEHTFTKVKELKDLIETNQAKCLIEIDGGVTLDNAKELLDSGADVLVAGSFVFRSNDPAHTISQLKHV